MAITVMIIMWLLSGINQKNIASNQQQNNVGVSTDISVRECEIKLQRILSEISN